MVERVARAMWEDRQRFVKSIDPNLPDLEEWGDGTIPKSNNVIGEARAAIAAMREPTAEMVKAAFDSVDFQSASESEIEDGWQSMIDAALKESTDA